MATEAAQGAQQPLLRQPVEEQTGCSSSCCLRAAGKAGVVVGVILLIAGIAFTQIRGLGTLSQPIAITGALLLGLSLLVLWKKRLPPPVVIENLDPVQMRTHDKDGLTPFLRIVLRIFDLSIRREQYVEALVALKQLRTMEKDGPAQETFEGGETAFVRAQRVMSENHPYKVDFLEFLVSSTSEYLLNDVSISK